MRVSVSDSGAAVTVITHLTSFVLRKEHTTCFGKGETPPVIPEQYATSYAICVLKDETDSIRPSASGRQLFPSNEGIRTANVKWMYEENSDLSIHKFVLC
jgi:hypothetical protein